MSAIVCHALQVAERANVIQNSCKLDLLTWLIRDLRGVRSETALPWEHYREKS